MSNPWAECGIAKSPGRCYRQNVYRSTPSSSDPTKKSMMKHATRHRALTLTLTYSLSLFLDLFLPVFLSILLICILRFSAPIWTRVYMFYFGTWHGACPLASGRDPWEQVSIKQVSAVACHAHRNEPLNSTVASSQRLTHFIDVADALQAFRHRQR